MKSKYKGIDERKIKCCCDSPACAEAGISFEENFLKFHFLEYVDVGGKAILMQKTKAMTLNKKNTKQLIDALSSLNSQTD